MTVYSPGSAASFELTLPADASPITVTIATAAGNVLLGPTAVGIAHLGTGQYLYTWPIPADQGSGALTLTWNATVGGVPEAPFENFTVSATSLPGTWCTVADVALYAGATVTQQDVNVAQQLIEGVVRRVWRASDEQTRDYYWLLRATAWQARYVNAHPEVLDMMDVQSLSQDGLSITFRSTSGQMIALYSPTALRFLNNLFRGSDTTIRLNSAFQKNRPPRGTLTGGSSIPWRSI